MQNPKKSMAKNKQETKDKEPIVIFLYVNNCEIIAPTRVQVVRAVIIYF
jgi:hypothetical protein